ncbi:hypothetical protein ACIRP4_33960 [Streptomyces bacillaris]|uniref:hypothetical protein n=1 Tax=Streptomyces bacillaris TaxID=68179 RepID=UPI0038269E4C
MIRPISGPPTWKHLLATLLIVLLISVGWYGLQPVYPDCALSSFGTPDDPQRLYQQAIEDGHCDPAYPRWKDWIA